MTELDGLVTRCVEDTAEHLHRGAANRLRVALPVGMSDDAIVSAIQRIIRKAETQSNGWEIDRKGGLSLEKIVLDECPDLFTNEDKEIARTTLGRKKPGK